VPRAPGERQDVYCTPLCPFSPLLATRYSMRFSATDF
jgi:hypothetical protein